MRLFVGIECPRGAEGGDRALSISGQEQRIAEIMVRFGQAWGQFRGAFGMRDSIAQAMECQIGCRHIHVGVRIERRTQDGLAENRNRAIGLSRRKGGASQLIQGVDIVRRSQSVGPKWSYG